MRSKHIGWDYEIRVALPPSYEKNPAKTYPVLWATDGALDVALAVVEAADKSYPEMIIVSVGTPPDQKLQNQARRDWEFSPTPAVGIMGYSYSGPGSDLFRQWAVRYDERKRAAGERPQSLGGAPIFLDFLVAEVRPTLKAQYRMSDDTILWGHSGGGMFCVFALLERPQSFRTYICGSPSLNASDSSLFKLEERVATLRGDLAASLFLAVGDLEAVEGGGIAEWGVASSTLRFAEILTVRNYPSLCFGFRVLPGKKHGTAWPAVLDAGLRWLQSRSKATRCAGTGNPSK